MYFGPRVDHVPVSTRFLNRFVRCLCGVYDDSAAGGVLAEMCCPVVGGVSMSVPAGPRGPVSNRNRNRTLRVLSLAFFNRAD